VTEEARHDKWIVRKAERGWWTVFRLESGDRDYFPSWAFAFQHASRKADHG
jgi:hypothetical protein